MIKIYFINKNIMGADTRIIINNRHRKNKINLDTIIKIISNIKGLDKKTLNLDITEKEDGDIYGFINFTITNQEGAIENRNIFYSQSPFGKDDYIYKSYKNLDFTILEGKSKDDIYEIFGPQEELDVIYLSTGYWGSSIFIMKEILKQIGGYLDFNDSDYQEYIEIKKEI